MPAKTEIEIFVVMDANGDYDLGTTQDNAEYNFDENVGGSGPRRTIRLVVKMTPPAVEDGPEVDVPDTAGETTDAEAA